ncbi:MAG: hypothetical protein OXC42_09300 [Gammaproteobacteria bacterium]|nr:hypothetical protein [Gammaproteobacteria bacterium]
MIGKLQLQKLLGVLRTLTKWLRLGSSNSFSQSSTFAVREQHQSDVDVSKVELTDKSQITNSFKDSTKTGSSNTQSANIKVEDETDLREDQDNQACSVNETTNQSRSEKISVVDPHPDSDPSELGQFPSRHGVFEGATTESQEVVEPSLSSVHDENQDPTKGTYVKAKPKQPLEIGGRRGRTDYKTRSGTKRVLTSRPELVCRKPLGSWRWEVVLSVGHEHEVMEVYHNNDRLDVLNNECCLRSFTGQLTILFEGGEKNELSLFDGKPIIFKLKNNWADVGRKTRGITKGYFVVIVPKDWNRMGHAPVEPGECTDAIYAAHYFYRDGKLPTEKIDGFQESEVVPISSAFDLTGERVFDDSDEGELFVGAVPVLNISPDVSWVRVGEEDEDGWEGENFRLKEKSLSEVLDGLQGRFFIRVYDSKVQLLDSGEFRYLRDLKEIRVNGEPYTKNTILVPTLTGHLQTSVSFEGINNVVCHPINRPTTTQVLAQENGLVVKPNPNCDDISCTLQSNTGSVDTVLHLPYVWWRMEQSDPDFSSWCEFSFAMTRQEFRKYAQSNGTLRLRLPRWLKSVYIGFNNELDRMYRPIKEERDVLIPLVHFIDYSQIDNPLNEDAFLNVRCAEETLTLVRVSADLMPKIISFKCEPDFITKGNETTLSWVVKDVGECSVEIDPQPGLVSFSGSHVVAPLKTTTYTLRLISSNVDNVMQTVTVAVGSPSSIDVKPIARVRRSSGKLGYGKGFSRGELQVAGLTLAEAVYRLIPFDKRRRSMHPVNIEMIRRSIDG